MPESARALDPEHRARVVAQLRLMTLYAHSARVMTRLDDVFCRPAGKLLAQLAGDIAPPRPDTLET